MEDDLDRIAAGEEQRVDWLTRFYKGRTASRRGLPGLHAMVTDHLDEIDARAVNSIELPGSDIVVRVGRYGPYLERGEAAGVAAGGRRPRRAHAGAGRGAAGRAGRRPRARRRPRDRPARAAAQRPLRPVRHRGARRRAPTRGRAPPRCSRSMSPETVTLDDGAPAALAAAGRRRVADGEEVLAMNGRYGPLHQARHRDPLAGERGAALHHRPRPGARPAGRAEDRAVGEERPSRRSGSLAQIPRPGVESWSRTADSVRT